ncbi:MAG: hypothetical protein KDC44_25340 [Phaeodactylibacter sp.]|nr:hypothetical protein [Phaeodactylibacter sp.]
MENERQQEFQDLRPDPASVQARILQNRHPVALLLDGVQDPRNLGLLFRLADAARLREVLLWNLPAEEPGTKARRIARSTVDYVPHRHLQDWAELDDLQSYYQLVALEYTNKSMPYDQFVPKKPVLLVVGSEVAGISPNMLERVEQSIHIPMFGMNTSMNVSCATAIASYALIRFFSKNPMAI